MRTENISKSYITPILRQYTSEPQNNINHKEVMDYNPLYVVLVSLSSKFQSDLLNDQFQVTDRIGPKCTEWPPRTIRVLKGTSIVLLVPRSIKFHYTANRFRVTAILRRAHQITPKLPWNLRLYMVKSIRVLLVSPGPKFHSYYHFRVTGQLQTSAQTYPNVCSSISVLQIFARFYFPFGLIVKFQT